VQGYGSATLVFRGIGPSLSWAFSNYLPNPVLQLFNSNGSQIAANDNWGDTQYQEIANSGLSPSNSLESAIKINLNPGAYTAILSCNGGCTGIGNVEVYDITPQPNAIRLANLSTRAHAENGTGQEIMGLIIQESGYKYLLFRGMGPSIPMSGTLPNPSLVLYGPNGAQQSNENWKDSQQSQIAGTGAAPSNDLESAMLSYIPASSYSAVMQDNSGATGIASIELYDLDPAPTPIPLRNVWHDPYGSGSTVGYNSNNDPNNNKVYLRQTGQLSPQAQGTIRVDFSGYSHGTCYYGCPYVAPPVNSTLYPELLDANGTKVAEGTHLNFPTGTGDVTVSTSAYFNNWSGAPFYIRMVASSTASYPEPDYVALTAYDVYAP
jgi:hypothetical protein